MINQTLHYCVQKYILFRPISWTRSTTRFLLHQVSHLTILVHDSNWNATPFFILELVYFARTFTAILIPSIHYNSGYQAKPRIRILICWFQVLPRIYSIQRCKFKCSLKKQWSAEVWSWSRNFANFAGIAPSLMVTKAKRLGGRVS